MSICHHMCPAVCRGSAEHDYIAPLPPPTPRRGTSLVPPGSSPTMDSLGGLDANKESYAKAAVEAPGGIRGHTAASNYRKTAFHLCGLCRATNDRSREPLARPTPNVNNSDSADHVVQMMVKTSPFAAALASASSDTTTDPARHRHCARPAGQISWCTRWTQRRSPAGCREIQPVERISASSEAAPS